MQQITVVDLLGKREETITVPLDTQCWEIGEKIEALFGIAEWDQALFRTPDRSSSIPNMPDELAATLPRLMFVASHEKMAATADGDIPVLPSKGVKLVFNYIGSQLSPRGVYVLPESTVNEVMKEVFNTFRTTDKQHGIARLELRYIYQQTGRMHLQPDPSALFLDAIQGLLPYEWPFIPVYLEPVYRGVLE